MRVEDVPPALRRVLGPDATDGLLGTLDQARREWTEDVMTRLVDRFERRLTDELSDLRVDFRTALASQGAELREALANQGAALREALANQRAEFREALAVQKAELREELAAQRVEFRDALAAQGTELRTAIVDQGAALRSEIASSRADIVKWLFVFWTGQLITLPALLNVLL